MPPAHAPIAARWRIGPARELDLSIPRLMAVLNITPDSFSDGGQYLKTGDALARAASAVEAGADALDIGGESTRPGAARVPAADQIRRVIPVIRAIRSGSAHLATIHISVDTTLAEVASAALDAGADAINDVSAGLEDAAMFPLAAERNAGLVLMHRLNPPGLDSYSDRYTSPPQYDDVAAEVGRFLLSRAEAALAAGVPRESIVLDPGLGFGKTVEQNLELIRRTGELCALGFPILSGLSRKSFLARAGGTPEAPPADRLPATIAASVLHYAAGARIFRVHDVAAHRAALRAAHGIATGQLPGGI